MELGLCDLRSHCCNCFLQVTLANGTLVVPLLAGAGTWRQSAVFDAAALYAIPDDIAVEAAATMSIK